MLGGRLMNDRKQESLLLEKITEMVASAEQTAQEIARQLVPPVLEIHGLVGALRNLAEQQCQRYGMACELRLGDPRHCPVLEGTVGVHIYRIAQEAVSNAIRHSDADRILINLDADDKCIEFSVSDDGKGMVKELISIGTGMATMKRRAELINATFVIQASPGAGTSIQCTIPLAAS